MFISLSWKHYLIDLLHNWLHLSSYILFGLPLIRLISDFLKSMINLLLFWYFKGTTHKYLLYMSTGNNKNWNPLLNLVIKWISIKSTRSWPQILSTFRLYIWSTNLYTWYFKVSQEGLSSLDYHLAARLLVHSFFLKSLFLAQMKQTLGQCSLIYPTLFNIKKRLQKSNENVQIWRLTEYDPAVT